jgi:hypothetical protein
MYWHNIKILIYLVGSIALALFFGVVALLRILVPDVAHGVPLLIPALISLWTAFNYGREIRGLL